MILEEKKVGKIAFKLFLNGYEGELVEEVTEDNAYEFLYGTHSLLESLEQRLSGLKKDAQFQFKIEKNEAYGDYRDEMIVDLDKKIFVDENGSPLDEELQIGNYIPMRDNENNLLNGKVMEVADDKVKLDFNHPLSGEDLYFIGKILDVREASDEEIDHGHVHGEGHHHH